MAQTKPGLDGRVFLCVKLLTQNTVCALVFDGHIMATFDLREQIGVFVAEKEKPKRELGLR